MASGWTNRGRFRILKGHFQRLSQPTNFYLALVTNATVPDADTNTLGQLTEVVAGSGYTAGGIAYAAGTFAFVNLTEDDANDWADIQLIDAEWLATGGDIPASGGDPRYAVLTDDNATLGSREVYAWWDLGSAQPRTEGNSLILAALKLRAKLPA